MTEQRPPRPSLVRLGCLAAGALLALVGCASHPVGPGATSFAPTYSRPSGLPSAGAARPIIFLAHYDIAENEVSHLHIWSHYLSYSSAGPSSQGNQTADRVTVIDLSTGHRRVVAHSRYPHGQCDIAAGVGDYVAWTDQPSTQSDDSPAVSWQLHVTSVITGKDKVIAASRVADPVVPVPTGDAGYVVWAQTAKNQRSADIHSYNIASGVNRTLVTGVGPSSTTVTGSWVVYDTGTSATGADVFEVPVTGGRPQRLTHSGLVALPQAGSGRIVWQQPNQGDPTSLWTAKVGSPSTPVQAVGGPSEGNAVPGNGFIAYWASPDSGGQVTVTMLDGRSRPVRSIEVSHGESEVPARIASDAHRIAWAEYLSGGGKTKPQGPQIVRIFVASVTSAAR